MKQVLKGLYLDHLESRGMLYIISAQRLSLEGVHVHCFIENRALVEVRKLPSSSAWWQTTVQHTGDEMYQDKGR